MSIPFAQLSFSQIYERELVTPLFRPFAESMLAELSLKPGERVLDVACGTGIVARLAQQRVGAQASVVGVDVNPAMLAVARELAPTIDWREGQAGALPLHAAETFDVAICHQGFQFFPDRAAAARELYRALAPHGRVGIGTWRSDEELPYLLELRRVAERHVGLIIDRRHSLGDGAQLEAMLRDAGFRNVRAQTVTHVIRFADPATWIRLNAMPLVGMSAAGKDLSEAERDAAMAAIIRDSEEVTRGRVGANGLTFELASNIVIADR